MKKRNEPKTRFLAIAIAIIVMTVVVVAYTYEDPIPSPGHGADAVWIDTTPGIAGGEMTVQDAVAAGFLSIDTKCNVAGACPQICIDSDCRNTWPSEATGITRLSAGSNITLSPNPITNIGTISKTDTSCETSRTCSEVCIGSQCRDEWPTDETRCYARLSGSCSCGAGEYLIASVSSTPCWANASRGSCGASGGLGGSCCVCGIR